MAVLRDGLLGVRLVLCSGRWDGFVWVGGSSMGGAAGVLRFASLSPVSVCVPRCWRWRGFFVVGFVFPAAELAVGAGLRCRFRGFARGRADRGLVVCFAVTVAVLAMEGVPRCRFRGVCRVPGGGGASCCRFRGLVRGCGSGGVGVVGLGFLFVVGCCLCCWWVVVVFSTRRCFGLVVGVLVCWLVGGVAVVVVGGGGSSLAAACGVPPVVGVCGVGVRGGLRTQ